MSSANLSHQLDDPGVIIVSTLQMKEPRLREVGWLLTTPAWDVQHTVARAGIQTQVFLTIKLVRMPTATTCNKLTMCHILCCVFFFPPQTGITLLGLMLIFSCVLYFPALTSEETEVWWLRESGFECKRLCSQRDLSESLWSLPLKVAWGLPSPGLSF